MSATQKRGTMVVSLDFELAWGRFDKVPIPVLKAEASEERLRIIRLLDLMDHYQIPATWATVGHLMLESCQRDGNGQAHPEVSPHARYSWLPYDWFKHDPCVHASKAPGWYAPDVVEWIQRTRVQHEIGSHSFGHIYFGDPECSLAMADADLNAAVKVASHNGLVLHSFVFPRNQIGHLEALKKAGFSCYRGADHRTIRAGNPVFMRGLHFVDQLLGLPPQRVKAEETLPGLWNIPGNHFLMPREGMRKLIPMASQVLKAKRGLKRAVQAGELYHLWFHPNNLIADQDAMFDGLSEIFSYASRLREEGRLEILTMGEYARQLEAQKKGSEKIIRANESPLRTRMPIGRKGLVHRVRQGNVGTSLSMLGRLLHFPSRTRY